MVFPTPSSCTKPNLGRTAQLEAISRGGTRAIVSGWSIPGHSGAWPSISPWPAITAKGTRSVASAFWSTGHDGAWPLSSPWFAISRGGTRAVASGARGAAMIWGDACRRLQIPNSPPRRRVALCGAWYWGIDPPSKGGCSKWPRRWVRHSSRSKHTQLGRNHPPLVLLDGYNGTSGGPLVGANPPVPGSGLRAGARRRRAPVAQLAFTRRAD